MQPYEDNRTEYKQEYVEDIRKEVVAFANSEGGKVVIGVRKDRVVTGLEDPDGTMVRVANMLKDAISPDVMPFVSIRKSEIEGLQIVEIEVSTGTNRPYYIREKGLKPSGVYVRKGSSSQPVSDEAIRGMIIAENGKIYERCRSLNQNLTFNTLKYEMERRGIAFDSAQLRTLKLIGEDGLYTNLALLLSDQCEVTTKTAVFQGSDKAVFRDREEFGGSLLQQLEEVYRYINLLNKTRAVFHDLDRIDFRDYPEEAVREALLNAFVHRDYSFSGSTIINVYDDRIEFVSLGGLVPGLELDSIYLGVSQSRNPGLAALFYRMRLIESYGTGIAKIMRSYSDQLRKPLIETAKGAFRVTLPNCNADDVELLKPLVRNNDVNGSVKSCDDSEKTIEFVRKNGSVTRKELEELLRIGQSKASKFLKEMCDAHVLQKDGNGYLTKYVLIEK